MTASYLGCVRLGVLGSLTVEVDGRPIAVTAGQERAVLGMLALSRDRSVSVATIIDSLWPDRPPPNARKAVQTYVTRLRKRIGPAAIESVGDGYRLDGVSVDATRFEELARRGRESLAGGTSSQARASLTDALTLWRGETLAELGDAAWVTGERTRLAELHRVVEEDLLDARLALGEHATVVADAEAAVASAVLRERRWGILMLALYRSGRQAEALRAYQRCRDTLVGELGVEPGTELRQLEQAILAQDRSLVNTARPPTNRPLPRALPAALDDVAQTALVGRLSHLRELDAAWASAIEGGRHSVLLSGEPGVGKTRLAAALATRVVEAGGVVLYGRCHAELAVPYQPVAEAVGPLLADASEGTLADALLATSSGERRVNPADAAADQYSLFEQVVQLLASATAEAPILLVIDDLQWATPPTRRLLRYVISAPALHRFLAVGTVRHTEGAPPRELGDLAGVHHVTVGPLALGEVEELVATRSPGDVESAASLHRLAGGNPFLVGQLLLDRATGAGDSGPPRRASEVLASRLSRLQEPTRTVLEMAALVGAEFDFQLLAAAGDERVLDALEEAETAGLVVPVSGVVGRFTFCHALARSVLADALPAARRLRLHGALARALEQRPIGPAEVAALAHHCAAAAPLGLGANAVRYARQAGEFARASLAFEEAADFFGIALDAMSFLGERDAGVRCDLLTARGEALRRAGHQDSERVLVDAARVARELGDPIRLAMIVLALDRGGTAAQDIGVRSVTCELAAEASDALGDGDPVLRARVLSVLATELLYEPVDEQRLAITRRSLALARRAGDPETLAHVLVGCITAWTVPEDLDGRLVLVRELIELGDQLGRADFSYRGHHALALGLMEAGRVDEYADARASARSLAAGLHQPFLEWEQFYCDAADQVLRGDLAAAEGLAADIVARGRRCGVAERTATAVYGSFLGGALWEMGRAHEVEALFRDFTRLMPATGPFHYFAPLIHVRSGELEKAAAEFEVLAVADFADAPRRYTWPLTIAFASEIAVGLDDQARCATLLALLRPLTGRIVAGDHLRWSPVDRVLARLCTALGRFDEARSFLDGAAAQSRRLGAPMFLARTRLDEARLAAARGDSELAAATAVTAVDMAARLGAHGIAEDATALLDRL